MIVIPLSIFRLFLACLIALSAAPLARADAPSAECSRPAADLDDVLRQEAACSRSADFMHQLGRMLLRAGRYAEAVDRLEAAIMLEPERWAAHLDYALARDAAGDRLSAAGVLAGLDTNPEIDEDRREALFRPLRRQFHDTLPVRSTVIGLSTGYDDNLLGTTRNGVLDLTLGDDILPVKLSDAEQQRGGRFVRFDLSHEADLYRSDAALWHYALVGSQRWSIDYRRADLTHLGVQIERMPTRPFGGYSLASLQHLQRGGHAVLRQWQVGAGAEWNSRWVGFLCRARLGGEFNGSQYPENGVFDGRYAGLMAHLVCPEQNSQIRLRVGEDRPLHADRPGGEQRQYALYLARQFSLGKGQLAAEYDYFRQRDREGYSPLLENNAARDVTRHVYRLEYRWRAGELSPYVGVEWLDQNSNLPLFAPRNRIVMIGVRHLW